MSVALSIACVCVLTVCQNWFQNRRAKVKQDRKKAFNQMNMPYGMSYGHGHPQQPVMSGQFPHHQEHYQAPMAMQSGDFYPVSADLSSSSLPVRSVEGPSALDMGSHISLQQQYEMQQQALRSMPEASRAATYAPNAVMNSFMAAANGGYMPNNGMSVNAHDIGFPYDGSGFDDFDLNLSVTMPGNNLPHDPSTSQAGFGSYGSMGGLPYQVPDMNHSAPPEETRDSTASLSSTSTPFSSHQQHATPQSANRPTPPSVPSLVSAYSGWTEDPNASNLDNHPVESEDQFNTPYNLNGASSSEQTLPFWSQMGSNPSFNNGFYQQQNVSSQAILSSPDQDVGRTRINSACPSDFDTPPLFGDEGFARRNSSTSNLAGNFESIHIRNGTPDDFKQPGPPTSIAQRRKGRPVTLNPGAMRSASYSAPMPSPGGSNDHTLRRIRSSGIGNAGGRVQKSQPGSAQRSPMVANFSEAAASPKFARAFSSSSTATVGQSGHNGSLAPPTPLTPQEINYWQNGTVIRPHSVKPDHNSPESLNTNWSAEPQSNGVLNNSVSPPTTSLELQQMTQSRLANEAMYRDSPPQSAPATQQNFPRPVYMQHPHMRSGFHSTTDLTLQQPKPSHYRRPSLPDGGAQQDENTYFQNGGLNYDDYKGISLTNINHNVPFAPPASLAPEFLVHEFMPPQPNDPHSHMLRRSTDPQPKAYIFANQGPGDFNS